MTLEFDLFWSFRSPYSYLALDRILDIHRRYDVEIALRLVYPFAVLDEARFPSSTLPRRPAWLRYLVLDCQRMADYHGIPFGWPRPDPIVQDMETNAIAKDQPHIYRLTRLGVAAALAGRGLAFIDQVARIIWDGSVDAWDQGSHLADAVARAGFDLARLEREVAADPGKLDAMVEANETALEEAGHWGRPTMVFEGEPFFGQDRIETLIWRMRQRGLAERS